jgi:phosphoglycolate phosphatase-like HAD superfamily hydrolase
MRIGIDFDNTIACYDGAFHAAARERDLVPADLSTDKTSVRDYLRAKGQDHVFTELQGYVYGARMELAALYAGLSDVMARLRSAGHSLYIISHKTHYPMAGHAYDLHEAARRFLDRHGLIDPAHIFFEPTKDAKADRVAALACEIFIDDLPEILVLPNLPRGLRAILFDPEGYYPEGTWQGRVFETYGSWRAIGDALLGK